MERNSCQQPCAHAAVAAHGAVLQSTPGASLNRPACHLIASPQRERAVAAASGGSRVLHSDRRVAREHVPAIAATFQSAASGTALVAQIDRTAPACSALKAETLTLACAVERQPKCSRAAAAIGRWRWWLAVHPGLISSVWRRRRWPLGHCGCHRCSGRDVDAVKHHAELIPAHEILSAGSRRGSMHWNASCMPMSASETSPTAILCCP